ncbi:MAG: hypothetical protein K8F35_01370 [Dokdonella sp.]|uniref:hypothetical protein n=1 Tax=Dokdonella sp. TaxID=2291710 RepID=UPI0025C46D11|nr:hypothetical protein [Dokdonella sp.]MBZ0221653.1 hypothetical protein [Dokdonella sp.]
MSRVALVTVQAARPLDADLEPLADALRAAGAEVGFVGWDDPAVDWAGFDVAVLRSTWDYTKRPGEFLAWAQATAASTRPLNSAEVLRWNTDKHCLAQLECTGIRSEAIAHLGRLLSAGRSVLMQPYPERVDEHGETALIHFDGSFSHAIRKGALLLRCEGPTQALFAAEEITARPACSSWSWPSPRCSLIMHRARRSALRRSSSHIYAAENPRPGRGIAGSRAMTARDRCVQCRLSRYHQPCCAR